MKRKKKSIFFQDELNFSIGQLYDSHVHWFMTGDLALGLSLSEVSSLRQLQSLEIKPAHWRGSFLCGFGWDETKFDKSLRLSCDTLDQVFPDVPVFFSRRDGHSSWLNTRALTMLGFMKGFSQNDQGQPHDPPGILREKDHMKALLALPAFSHADVVKRLQAGQDIFLSQGFTHIREMTATLDLWKAAVAMEAEGQLKMHVDLNFVCDNLADFPRALSAWKTAFDHESRRVKARGIKIFFDGSLGSGTALITNRKTREISGMQLWSMTDFEEVVERTWQAGAEISIHALGDEAVDLVVRGCRAVNARGISGILNLEHVQVLRPETLPLMKALHVRCHLQPCHWLSDRHFLRGKEFENLAELFPWERLRTNNIPISFGSDSPIEPPNFGQNLKALQLSTEAGIAEFGGDLIRSHQYPFGDGILAKSVFRNGSFSHIEWGSIPIPVTK